MYLPVFEERKKTALAPTKVLLFIGRYHAQKNVIALWKSFMELSENEGSDWELWCVGTGPETPVKHSKIKHFGFLQPQETIKLISQSHAFILPSQFEPWGVVVEAGSVLSMGVFIGQSTRIYNRQSGEILYGKVPAGSVVVPGSMPDAGGKCSLYCAVIVKRVDAQTRAKTSLNDLLRD